MKYKPFFFKKNNITCTFTKLQLKVKIAFIIVIQQQQPLITNLYNL